MTAPLGSRDLGPWTPDDPRTWEPEAGVQGLRNLEPWSQVPGPFGTSLDPGIQNPQDAPFGAWNSGADPFPEPWWWSPATAATLLAPGPVPLLERGPFQGSEKGLPLCSLRVGCPSWVLRPLSLQSPPSLLLCTLSTFLEFIF